MRVGIVGSGIAGLGAAWLLSRKGEVTLFEAENRLGGHAHTVRVDWQGVPYDVDTGFIVYNEKTYPLLTRLFRELGVSTRFSDMSFSVTDGAFEFASHSLSGLFARRRHLVSPRYWRFLADIIRFNRLARQWVREGDETTTIGAWLAKRRFSPDFTERYLRPLFSAIWSTGRRDVDGFPARRFFAFFDNHGLIQLRGAPRWRVVSGGSSRYVERIERDLLARGVRILRGAPARSVTRLAGGGVRLNAGETEWTFDAVVMACHAPQALAILASPTDAETRILGALPYVANKVLLHTDTRVMPRSRAAWASWNYRIRPERDNSTLAGTGARATLTYDMGRLQSLPGAQPFFVSLNLEDPPEETILRRLEYEHPLYTLEGIQAQEQWAEINGTGGVYYCGAYWGYGFHEDGLASAARVAEALGVTW